MLIKEMNGWRIDGLFADAFVIVDGIHFQCHRVALATASEFFDMLPGINFQQRTCAMIPLFGITDANTFGIVLQFIYTGKVELTRENVYHLLVTAHRLKLRIPLEKECVTFIERNSPIQHMFHALSFALQTEKNVLLYHIANHISCNLQNFSETSDFLLLPSEVIKMIIDLSTVKKKIVVNAITVWINHKRGERWRYFSQLSHLGMMAGVTFAKIQSLAQSFIPDGISNEDVVSYLEDLKRTSSDETLLVYWSSGSPLSRNIVEISIGHSVECNTWSTFSAMIALRKVTINKSLVYRLTSKLSSFTDQSRVFFTCCTPNGTNFKELLLPGQDDYNNISSFEMCGLQRMKRLYLYIGTRNSIFEFDCDADMWCTIWTKKEVTWAAMATCENTNTVYLIGGNMDDTYIQAYNSCTREWTVLPGLNYTYSKGAVMCTLNGKIYVYNEIHRVYEIYDPSTYDWHTSLPNPYISAAPAKRLIAYGDELWLFSDGRPNKYDGDDGKEDVYIAYVYKPGSNLWRKYPLMKAAAKRRLQSTYSDSSHHFLDAVVF